MDRKLVILHQWAEIRKSGDRLRLINCSGTAELPVRYVDGVIVMGKVSLGADALNLLLFNRIPVFFLTKYGKLKGVLTSEVLVSANNNRLRQFESFLNRRLEVAREIVRLKVDSIEKEFRIGLDWAKRDLSRASSVEELMGVEGSVSKAMFDAFRESIANSGLNFKGRSYNPPKDEVNALLSLSYSFLYSVAFPLVIHLGYDPYLSFLHSKRGTHASFCSDVIEPVRAFITNQVLWAIKDGIFLKKDFTKAERGYVFKKDGLLKFHNWFERIKPEAIERVKEAILSVGEAIA